MGRKKDMFLIIDTETCNTLEQPMVYDIGYAICDREGNIYVERSFVVAEVFFGMSDVMQSAYYANKIPKYYEGIAESTRIVKSIFDIRKTIRQDIENFGVKTIGAYNMDFDKRALNNSIRYASKSIVRWFFPYGVNYICIWHMACQTLLATAGYVKFAIENGLETEKGNLLTSAEACFKFIERNLDFVESHTGLEDVKIEIQIMVKCFKTHKKMDKTINRGCWRLPQNKRSQMMF